mmetsp:Transcript_3809/g.14653  ORF Transcript_3809/g.14653 Transcript_3809/m.14653 type:complete len:247 (+) Transcript_3809:837-1577(+)
MAETVVCLPPMSITKLDAFPTANELNTGLFAKNSAGGACFSNISSTIFARTASELCTGSLSNTGCSSVCNANRFFNACSQIASTASQSSSIPFSPYGDVTSIPSRLIPMLSTSKCLADAFSPSAVMSASPPFAHSPTALGNTCCGVSCPAYPALTLCVPRSITTALTSSPPYIARDFARRQRDFSAARARTSNAIQRLTSPRSRASTSGDRARSSTDSRPRARERSRAAFRFARGREDEGFARARE